MQNQFYADAERAIPEEWKKTEAYKSIVAGMNEMEARGKAFKEGMKNPDYKKPIEIQKVLDEINEFLTSKGYEFVVEDRKDYFMCYKATKENLPFDLIEVSSYWQSFGSCPINFYVKADRYPNHKHSEFARHANYDDDTRRRVYSRKLRNIWKKDFNKASLIRICTWRSPNNSNATGAMYDNALKELEENCGKLN